MSRLREHGAKRPGLFARLIYFATRRKLGRVPEPVKVLHANGALLAGVAAFELGLERSTAVPARLKLLTEILAATRVGCPF